MSRKSPRSGARGGPRRGGDRAGGGATTPFRPAPLGALHLGALALILVAAVLIYAPSTDRPFFADDYLFLDQVRDRPLLTALVSVDPLSNFYRPVSRQLYFWLVGHASGEAERAFHVTSVVLFLVLLVLLFGLARRLAGNRAALIATGFLALNYAPDVAVRWACGSQELLAVIGALAAIWLHVSGRRVWAGVAMLLAALSKEVILLTPVVAVLADRRPGEGWGASLRRAWPLAAAVGVWVAQWALLPHRRAQQGTEVELDPTGPFATLAHLFQVALGFEWRRGEFGQLPRVGPPLVALALVLAGVLGSFLRRTPARVAGAVDGAADAVAEPGAPRAAEHATGAAREVGGRAAAHDMPTRGRARNVVVVGVVWALVAAAPVTAVAILWSAYYYLFAMCAVGLVLGVLLSRRHWGWTAAAFVVLAWGSASARHLEEFATPRSPWTAQSHINAYYMDRSAQVVTRYLGDIRRAHPEFPHGSTVFYAGLKANVAFQVANGPLLRWAYRDTSLRSYYLYDFTRDRVRRGPTYFFLGEGDSLRELPKTPDLYGQLALGMMASDQPEQARDALTLHVDRNPHDADGHARLGWVLLSLGQDEAARVQLEEAGMTPAGPTPVSAAARGAALAALARGDTARALAIAGDAAARYALDPDVRALLADLLLVRDPDDIGGVVEAFAARALAPRDPYGWRRWGMVQVRRKRYLQALDSFGRYQELGGAAAARDTEVSGWIRSIHELVPASAIARAERRD